MSSVEIAVVVILCGLFADVIFIMCHRRILQFYRIHYIKKHFDTVQTEWIDPTYARLAGFEEYISAMKKDEKFKDLLANHPMVDDALGQLEVAIKLSLNL